MMETQYVELFDPRLSIRKVTVVPESRFELTGPIRNGKVDGMGITHPSAAGQERVVRSAYEKAQLDPHQTAYAELHGTGTPVGDPIEVRAISRAMNDTRSNDRPLLVGAVC